jgi:hypothetical protein
MLHGGFLGHWEAQKSIECIRYGFCATDVISMHQIPPGMVRGVLSLGSLGGDFPTISTGSHSEAVPSPPRRYRRSLASKGRFAVCVHQRDLRGNPFRRPSEKAISRGDRLCRSRPSQPLSHCGRRQGARLPVVSWVMARVYEFRENSELYVRFRGCCA